MEKKINEIREEQRNLLKLCQEDREERKEQAKILRRLEFALLGDREAGIDGLVIQVKRHQKYIDNSKKRYTFAAGIVATIITIKEWFF